MKIEWVDLRLQRWAFWSVRGGQIRGLWYARCSFAGMIGGGTEVDVEVNEEAQKTHAAITLLNPPELRAAVHAYYTGRGTLKQKAKDLQCSEKTMMRRIHHAHQRLVSLFNQVDKPVRAWPVQCSFGRDVDSVTG